MAKHIVVEVMNRDIRYWIYETFSEAKVGMLERLVSVSHDTMLSLEYIISNPNCSGYYSIDNKSAWLDAFGGDKLYDWQIIEV